MSKNIFEDEKRNYENIEIPEELSFRVKKAIKIGKKEVLKKRIYNVGKSMAALFIIFVASVNISATAAEAFSSIPGFKKLVELVRFNGGDDGFENAVESGLVQSINYSEEKNGIKFKLNSLSGDYKRLWVNYEIEDIDKYDVDIMVKPDYPISNQESVAQGTFNINDNYFETTFNVFPYEITFEFKVYKKGEGGYLTSYEPISTFIVPVKLDEAFNVDIKEFGIKAEPLKLDIGTINFVKFETSKTGTVLKFKFDSNYYDSLMFLQCKIINKDNEVYVTSSESMNSDIQYGYMEFNGEIPFDKKELIMKFDEIYVHPKEKIKLKVDINNKTIDENPFGIEVDSIDGSYVRLRSKLVEDFSIVREIEDGISVIGGSREGDYVYSNVSIYEAKEGFEIYSVVFKDEREVKLKISE